MEQLLTQIDSIKQKMTDQEYRDIMDSLKTLHDEEEDFKYEVVVAHIENTNRDINGMHPKYEIHKRVLRPRKFVNKDKKNIERLIKATNDDGGILSHPIPLWIDFTDNSIKMESYLPNSICGDTDDDIVAEYQEYTLLAVRKI